MSTTTSNNIDSNIDNKETNVNDKIEETAPEVEVEATDAAPEVETDERSGNEAAKYRRRLRDAEAQRDALNERLVASQRREVERVAEAVLSKPAALWAGGADLADLLDDAGDVDADKVLEAANRTRDEFGIAPVRSVPAPDPTQGGRGGSVAAPPSFTDAFRPRS